MIKIIGYLLVSSAIVFLGFSIYRATDAIVPHLEEANKQIDQIRTEIEQIKGEIPGLAKKAGEGAVSGAFEGAKEEAKTTVERALSPDPRQHLDPANIFGR
jgi:hypothetical protein